MSILDKLGFAFLIMLIGLMIVFFGLIILICLIKLMSIIVGALTGKKKEQAAPAPAPVVVPEPVAEAAAEETGLENDELIAVITAALAAFNKDGNKTLVVRSVRRAAAKTPAWAKAGRADQLASRF
ncbi:MAG: OadG family protein [Clostridiales bacterium]|nr:OadG family protein [Clostridiales bacterium]MDD6872215.1 OadG family protein [Clostridiales bacterium]MDD7367087.1 OadG family protein [Clostridiales bacterium]MDY2872044.1 OadG family protein [Eubacteriales bacterium]